MGESARSSEGHEKSSKGEKNESEILGRIKDEEPIVVKALTEEMRKAEAALNSYVGHALKKAGFSAEEHALPGDLQSAIKIG
ncbi:MAG: hypothetical protein ABSB82_16965 [Terriglobia bacterium]|jgi:hypothetical protein